MGIAAIFAASFSGVVCGQSNLNFNGASATIEGAIRLSWNSTTGEVYQIQGADTLVDPDDGTTPWRTLYDNYPSQGTNTFWLDTGSFPYFPMTPHPKNSAARFYRIFLEETDTAPTKPDVSITSPVTNSAVSNELTITVSASTDQAELLTKLYVDGQEMRSPIDQTNWVDDATSNHYYLDTYSINTCEWPNGLHILFATAECISSSSSGLPNSLPALVGHSVSPFVPVTFTNLITRISFSEPFFKPSLGQTQEVKAVFAANVDWTLLIKDVDSNTVRTATGSGGSMRFDWDGKGNGGTNIPPGVYYYYVSAQTNGAPLSLGAEDDSFSQESLSSTSSSETWYPRTAR